VDTDGDLVRQLRKGRREAFDELLQRYQDSLYAFIRARVDDAPTADDLAQDVFVAVYRKIDQLKEPGNFAQWLFGIARYKVLQHIRAMVRRRDRGRADFDELAAPPLTEDSGELWVSLLRGLDDASRAVLLLRFRDGLSYRELSERLGMTVSAVGTLLHRARRTAARNLERAQGAVP
jgi:RNA polymerase sigma-70 factor (ECF subfamily)